MAAKKAPKRPNHASGTSGRNIQPQRLLRAPQELWDLVDDAIAQSDSSGWSDWARAVLTAAAELEISKGSK